MVGDLTRCWSRGVGRIGGIGVVLLIKTIRGLLMICDMNEMWVDMEHRPKHITS